MKFGKKIGDFNLQKAQNLSGEFKMLALKQRIFVGHLERAKARTYALTRNTKYVSGENPNLS
ncbi:hypothetical protein A4S05_20375 [Nostoc sp. KVJ20]|nr:hypothetical protein A4S05_20375 [Nostoc sp. KVJ20]